MHILHIIEAALVAAIVVVAWISVAHDHEGEWVDTATGEKFVIAALADRWTATSPNRVITLTRAGLNFQTDVVGIYDRWAGHIVWPDATWRRVTAGRRHPLNWITARNLIQSWRVDGEWFGRSGDVPIYLRITKQSAELRNGTTETLTVETTPTGLKFTNALGEIFAFSWDGHARATLEINKGRVVMERLD